MISKLSGFIFYLRCYLNSQIATSHILCTCLFKNEIGFSMLLATINATISPMITAMVAIIKIIFLSFCALDNNSLVSYTTPIFQPVVKPQSLRQAVFAKIVAFRISSQFVMKIDFGHLFASFLTRNEE